MSEVREPLEQMQLAALYHASQSITSAAEVFERCSVEDFEPGSQQKAAAVIHECYFQRNVDPLIVQDKIRALGSEPYKWFMVAVSQCYYGQPSYVAMKVREASSRRKLQASLTRAMSSLESSVPVGEITLSLREDLTLADLEDRDEMPTFDLPDLLATEDDIRPWIVPSMLRTNERLIITGPEGGGKSVLVAQMCLGAAMGINTLSASMDFHNPMRVLMLDVENDRLQIRDNARKVWPALKEMRSDHKPDITWFDQTAIDLSDSVHAHQLVKAVKNHQPDLLYAGSLYRLCPEGETPDFAFKHVSRVVDTVRQETNCSVILEAHSGHGMQNDRNGMRPYGASSWMRWPEYGFGMIKHRESGHMQLKAWRGARSDDRQWPGGLKRGVILPWQGIPRDEWEAEYE